MHLVKGSGTVAVSSDKVASAVFHLLLIAGELGTLYTAFRGINPATEIAALFLLLAGLLTLIYPHVGTDRRIARWVWGTPQRSFLPWYSMGCLLMVVALYACAGFAAIH
jgi:hypothetical protein